MNCLPVSIYTLDYWRPHKLEGHGVQLTTAARVLLTARGHELSQSHHIVAEDLLDHAEDYRQVLRRKHLLPRAKLARRYDRMAVEAFHVIEDMLVLQLRPLCRPTRS